MLDIEKISNEKAFLIGVVTGGLSPEVVEEQIFHRKREGRANCQSGQDAGCKSDCI